MYDTKLAGELLAVTGHMEGWGGSLCKWNQHKEVNQRILSMDENSMKMPFPFILVKNQNLKIWAIIFECV